jgi:hypothetical protein
VPRRIQLPDADALFGESPGPPVPAGAQSAAAAPVADVPKRVAKTARQRPASAAPKPAVPAPRSRATAGPAKRLGDLEASLEALPIDTLLSVRAELEVLLVAERISPAAVRRLLDAASIAVH